MEIECIPHRCPVCSGTGKLSIFMRKDPDDDTCHGCGGDGVVMGQRTRITPTGYNLKPPWQSSLKVERWAVG